MANDKDSVGASGNNVGGNAATVNITTDTLAAAFQQGMSAALAQAKGPVPETSEAYLARKRAQDPANQLKRPVFQNGQPIQIKGASQNTINHLNNLQPGEYLDGAVTVTIRGSEPDQRVFITTPLANKDERLQFYMRVSSFSDMVQKIANERKAAATAAAP